MSVSLQTVFHPMVVNLSHMIDLRQELAKPNPSAESTAMSERVQDAELADTWGKHPVTEAQNYAWLLLHACEDHIRVLCLAVTAEDYFPIWGLLPPARAALEAAGRAADISELDIGARTRVERFMNEDLYALEQVRNLPPEAKDAEQIGERRQQVLDSARRHGFARTSHPDKEKAEKGALAKPPQLGPGRPGYLDVVRRLFDSDPDLGKVTYQWYSAGTHATAWEIYKPLSITEVNDTTGITTGQLARDPREIHLVLSGVLLGYLEAATRCLQLHGWANQQWARVAVNSIRVQREVGERIGRNAPPTPPATGPYR